MATGVGLSIGASESVAAIVTTGQEPSPVYVLRDSVLHMSADGAAALGGIAPAGYSHTIVDYLTFMGSPAGIAVDDSEPYRAEDLVATALFCLLNLATEHLVGPAEFYAAHPPDWPAEHVALLRESLNYLGLRSVVLTPATADTPAEAALAAATSAYAAVLATPAGTTPPDSGPAENASADTTVLPAIDQPAEAQAYSAAPQTAAQPVLLATLEAAVPIQPPGADRPPARRTLLLVGIGVALLLVLGGIGVDAAVHGESGGTANNSDATAPTSSVARGIPAPMPPRKRAAPISEAAPGRAIRPRSSPAAAPATTPTAPVSLPARMPQTVSPMPSIDPYSPYYQPQIPGMNNPDTPSYPSPTNPQPYVGVQPYFHYAPPQ